MWRPRRRRAARSGSLVALLVAMTDELRGVEEVAADRLLHWLSATDPGRALVRRLDRLGCSERIIFDALNELRNRGIGICSLTEPQLDTAVPRSASAASATGRRLILNRYDTKITLAHDIGRGGAVPGGPTVRLTRTRPVAERVKSHRMRVNGVL